jgi:hypothetical protein
MTTPMTDNHPVTKMGLNTIRCPDCSSSGTVTVRVGDGPTASTIGYFMCGANTRDDHRPPRCYEQELSRVELRRTDTLDYLREACVRHGDSEAGTEGEDTSPTMQELVNVTNILCGGKPLYDL